MDEQQDGRRKRRRRRRVVLGLVLALGAGGFGVWRALPGYGRLPTPPRAAAAVFLVDPYVQLGDAPRAGSTASLEVLWQADDRDARWSVEFREAGAPAWKNAGEPACRRDARPGLEPRRYYRATLAGLAPGAEVSYRVGRPGARPFEATARAPRAPGQPHRFVAFGDGGAGTWEQREIAWQAARARPAFVFIAGDLAYYKGLLSEYLTRFFPAYNSDEPSPSWGAPLLRSVPVIVAPGNHDLLETRLDDYPDALAYFLVWSLPLNGPIDRPGDPHAPRLRGTEARRRAFLDLAGPAFPRMASYSFDYGDAHWTVLDTNPYADWTDPKLRAWLEADLASARDARWRFVAFHQPPFHSSKAHADEQRTRVLAELFQRHKVDLVISCHIHNYQRSYPLRFVADREAPDGAGHLPGRWTLDTAFDGRTRTRPDGVIYLVTGAGGARLYDAGWLDTPALEPFTARFVSHTHSLTVVDVDADRLLVRQVDAEGTELDRFVVTHGDPVAAAAPPELETRFLRRKRVSGPSPPPGNPSGAPASAP
jgi:3',5'-cyclic AMP phosphodiesterase CpdA